MLYFATNHGVSYFGYLPQICCFLLEREEDLERRYEMLQRELRVMMNVQDWEKTDAQKRREDLLLQELVQVTWIRVDWVIAFDCSLFTFQPALIVYISS